MTSFSSWCVCARLNPLPHSPRVRTSTAVASGTAARMSAAARAAPTCSRPSRLSRPLGHSTTFCPAFSAAITFAMAVSVWRRSSALADTSAGTLMARRIHPNGASSGLRKLVSSTSGRNWNAGHRRVMRLIGSANAGWFGITRYGPGCASASRLPRTVTQ